MRYLVLFFLLLAIEATAQTSATFSMNGIGPFKLNMKKSAVEQLTGKPVQLSNLLREDWNFDTVACSAGGLEVQLVFDRQYSNDKDYEYIVRGIISRSPSLKTPSGIAIGDDKFKIITAYEAYTLWIVPDWEDEAYTRRSKTKSSVYLQGDESGNVIIFMLEYNRVTGMTVTWGEAYD